MADRLSHATPGRYAGGTPANATTLVGQDYAGYNSANKA